MSVTSKAKATVLEPAHEDLERLLTLPGSTAIDARDLRLGFLIHDVSRLRRNAFDQLMRPLAVTRSQWWVIAHLSRREGVMQTELAEVLDIGKVTLGGLVDRLEASGWVKRRPDAKDRRVKRVYLTPAATALIRQMRDAERQHNGAVLADITSEERDVLVDLLGRIKRNLREFLPTIATDQAQD